MVVNAMNTKVGEKVGRGALTRNLGNMIYGENLEQMKATVKKNYAPLASATKLEFGYKLLDVSSQAAANRRSGSVAGASSTQGSSCCSAPSPSEANASSVHKSR